jgi:hypothetical protein
MSEPGPDLARVAVHEAGHAAAGFMLSRHCKVVSIIPSQAYAGVTIFGASAMPEYDVAEVVALPVFLQPARFRRFIETDIVISLAGPSAAMCLSAPRTGYVADEPDEEQARQVAKTAILTKGERERLDRSASRPVPDRTDEEKAERLSWAIAGNESAGAYLNWLMSETRHLVLSERFRGYVNALVPPLLEHKTLSGRAARRLMQETITK